MFVGKERPDLDLAWFPDWPLTRGCGQIENFRHHQFMPIFRFSTHFPLGPFLVKKSYPRLRIVFFWSDSRRSMPPLTPILRNLEFPYEDPKYGHIWNDWISHFWGKYFICGLWTEISAGNKNCFTSGMFPENLGLIGQKFAILKKNALLQFFLPITVRTKVHGVWD